MASSYAAKAIMAKARAIHSRSLNAAGYNDLLGLTSYSDLVEALRHIDTYQESLSDLPPARAEQSGEEQISRRDLENRLRIAAAEGLQDFLRYDQSGGTFYRYIFVEMDVEHLIHCIYSLRAGMSTPPTYDVPRFAVRHLEIDVARLAEVKTFTELLDLLRHTRFHSVLAPFAADPEPSLDYLGAEAALLKYFANYILNTIDALPMASEQKALRRYYCQYMELDNLRALFRLKAFPSISSERIASWLSYFPEAGLRHREWQSLLACADQQEFIAILEQSALGKRLGDLSSIKLLGTEYFGFLTHRLHYKNSIHLLRFSSEGPAAFMALQMLRRQELANLVALIEGAHYHLSAEDLRPLLVY